MNDSAQSLKDRVDLRDVIALFWGDPRRRRRAYDVHASHWRDDGSRPSFTVYPRHFKDFGGDGASGDLYAFLQRELNVDFKGAVQWAQQYTGGILPTAPPPTRPAAPAVSRDEPPPADWQLAARAALAEAQVYLWSDHDDARRALNYLRTARGLHDDSIRQAGYGYNPAWKPVNWVNPATGRPARLAPGIIEPWTSDGALWALRVRCRVDSLADALGILPDQMRGGPSPKYLNLAGSRQSGALYNGDRIQPGGAVLVVEGGFDAALAGQTLGADIAVVTFGSATNHPTGRRIRQLQEAGQVFLLLDSDRAGQDARQRLAAALGEKACIVPLPAGKDITDYIIQHGGDLRALLRQACSGAWWPGGLPDTIRAALLSHFPNAAAPVIEMVNRAAWQGLIDAHGFTINDLIAASDRLAFSLSAASIRRVIAALDGHFFAKLQAESQGNSACKTEKNRGRRSIRYRMLPLRIVRRAIVAWAIPRLYERAHPTEDEGGIVARPQPAMLLALDLPAADAEHIAKELDRALQPVYAAQDDRQRRAAKRARLALERLIAGLDAPHSTPLPEGWPLASAGQYRAAFLRATNDPNARRSRREIAELIGVCDRSVGTMIRRAGLGRVTKSGEYEDQRLEAADGLERQVKTLARTVSGYPVAVVVQPETGAPVETAYRGAASQAYVAAQIHRGARVFVRFQVANRYTSVRDLPLPTRPRTSDSRSGRDKTRPRDHAPRKTPVQPRWGPDYDPAWVYGQLRLALTRQQPDRYAWFAHDEGPALLDMETGEFVIRPPARTLLALLLAGAGPGSHSQPDTGGPDSDAEAGPLAAGHSAIDR